MSCGLEGHASLQCLTFLFYPPNWFLPPWGDGISPNENAFSKWLRPKVICGYTWTGLWKVEWCWWLILCTYLCGSDFSQFFQISPTGCLTPWAHGPACQGDVYVLPCPDLEGSTPEPFCGAAEWRTCRANHWPPSQQHCLPNLWPRMRCSRAQSPQHLQWSRHQPAPSFLSGGAGDNSFRRTAPTTGRLAADSTWAIWTMVGKGQQGKQQTQLRVTPVIVQGLLWYASTAPPLSNAVGQLSPRRTHCRDGGCWVFFF